MCSKKTVEKHLNERRAQGRTKPGAMLQGKRALVVGVANARSIAWGIANRWRQEGAEVFITYQVMGNLVGSMGVIFRHRFSPVSWEQIFGAGRVTLARAVPPRRCRCHYSKCTMPSLLSTKSTVGYLLVRISSFTSWLYLRPAARQADPPPSLPRSEALHP